MKTKNGVLGFDLSLYPSDELVAEFKDDENWERLHEYLTALIVRAVDVGLGEWFGHWEIDNL